MKTRPAVDQLRILPPDSGQGFAFGLQSKESRWDAFSSRPGYGITPERVYRIFRSAEMGYTRDQCELFEDLLENDGHAQGQYNSRIEGVSGKDLLIEPGDQTQEIAKVAAARLQSAIEQTNILEFIEHQLTAFLYGYAGSEPRWEFVDGWWVPTWFVNMPHTRFVWDEYNNPRLSTESNPWPGDPLSPVWCMNIARGRIAARAGAGRCVAWWSTFKRMSVRDWIIFAEKFGIPIVLGIWKNNASEETRKAVEQAVVDIGEAGQAVMNEAASIQFSNQAMRSGDTSALHPSVVNLCNAEISKVITGATLAVETGGPGSFALGKVHESRALALQVADARRVQSAFRRSIGYWFHRLNGLPTSIAPPRLRIQVLPELDPLTRAQVASILANELGMTLDGDQLHTEFGFRRPASDATAVKGTKNAGAQAPSPPPPAPGE